MTNLKINLFAILFFAFLTGCNTLPPIKGSNDTATVTLDLADFEEVQLSSTFRAEIIQADKFKVEITCNSNLKEYLDVKTQNNTLKVKLKSGHSYNNTKLRAKIHMPVLSEVKTSGVSRAKFKNFKCENLTLDCSGASGVDGSVKVKNELTIDNSGVATIEIDGVTHKAEIESSGASKLYGKLKIKDKLVIDASGTSMLDLEGSAHDAKFDFSGASNLSGKNMTVNQNSDIECSGTSTVTITANGKINADLGGASKVNYYGKGTVEHQDVSGVSSINKK